MEAPANKETPLARGNALLAAGDVDGALKAFKEVRASVQTLYVCLEWTRSVA
jgi:hypothetical protein